jgi:hypothetical protein
MLGEGSVDGRGGGGGQRLVIGRKRIEEKNGKKLKN